MQITNNSTPAVILVSSQHGGLGIIRSLGRQGIPVYGVHQHSWEPAARSRFLRKVFVWDFATSTAADSVAFLLELAHEIPQRPVLIPTADVTALFLAENAELLAKAYLFATASAEVVRGFSSKKWMFDLCRKMGVPTAGIAVPQSRPEVREFLGASQFPVIVKGEGGEFLRKPNERARVAIVAGEKELLEIFDLNSRDGPPNLIFQEYIPGGDDTVWMFNGYFNENSECLFGATGRKLRQFPAHRGSTSLGTCEENEVVKAQTLELMRAVGYRGPLDVGYRYDARDRRYKLLDVNPRIGSTFRLFTAENGLDVGRALFLHLTNQEVLCAPVHAGRKWLVESNDFVSSFTSWREGQLSAGEWLRSLRGVEERAWLAWDDPAPVALLPFVWWRKRASIRGGRAPAKSVKSLAR
jgi:D-aspartate ligase